MDTYLTEREAAKAARISRDNLRRAIVAGALPCIASPEARGRTARRLITTSALRTWIEAGRPLIRTSEARP